MRQASPSLRGNQSPGSRPLPIHLVQEWSGIASNRHGGAFNHRAGGWPRCQPLLLFPPLSLLLLKPLLRHLPPIDGCMTVGPGREKRGLSDWNTRRLNNPW